MACQRTGTLLQSGTVGIRSSSSFGSGSDFEDGDALRRCLRRARRRCGSWMGAQGTRRGLQARAVNWTVRDHTSPRVAFAKHGLPPFSQLGGFGAAARGGKGQRLLHESKPAKGRGCELRAPSKPSGGLCLCSRSGHGMPADAPAEVRARESKSSGRLSLSACSQVSRKVDLLQIASSSLLPAPQPSLSSRFSFAR